MVANIWDNGYPSGGNYWGDYTGVDVMSGPAQDIPGADGIGDTPYTNIDGGAGAQDNYPLMNPFNGTSPVPLDTTPPTSSVDAIAPYWHRTTHVDITATAADAESGVAFVELWRRDSSNNASWNGWIKVANDTSAPWAFTSDIQNGTYYEFYSRAGDNAGNYEAAPGSADARCGHDPYAPTSSADAIGPSTPTSFTLPISHTSNDALSGVKNVTLWYSFSTDGTAYGPWQRFGTESVSPTFADFTFNFPSGNGYYQFYTRATDFAGNWENAPAGNDTWVLRIAEDTAAPTSSVDAIAPYWRNTSSLPITASASDADSAVANITLRYRHSANNATWGNWANFDLDTTEPWNWTFGFPDGQGYYEFYSIANDTANNTEVAPATADARCAYDITPSQITDTSPAAGTTGDGYTFRAIVTDNMNLSAVHVIYWFGTGSETNATMTHTTAGNRELAITIPLNSLDTLHYRIAAVDRAGNWNSTLTRNVAITDNDDPVANAGADRTVDTGTIVIFNGSGSTDNIGITNYTWTFTHNGSAVTLHDVTPAFRFWAAGNYTVTLNVTDSAGNWDTDTMMVAVNAVSAPPTDTDGDGVPDDEDAFPDDPDEWADTDGDGVGDNADAFPTDPAASVDSDGDGSPDAWNPDMGAEDSTTGLILDAFPDDPNKWEEEDGGIGDYWWIIIILIVVLVIGAILGRKMMKGKKTAAPETEEGAAENPIEEELGDEQSTELPKNE